MIWAILLLSFTAAPLAAIFVVTAIVHAQAKPIVIIRDDMGFGGDWK